MEKTSKRIVSGVVVVDVDDIDETETTQKLSISFEDFFRAGLILWLLLLY